MVLRVLALSDMRSLNQGCVMAFCFMVLCVMAFVGRELTVSGLCYGSVSCVIAVSDMKCLCQVVSQLSVSRSSV